MRQRKNEKERHAIKTLHQFIQKPLRSKFAANGFGGSPQSRDIIHFVPLAGAKEAKVGYNAQTCQYVVSSPCTQLGERLNMDEITVDGIRVKGTTESLESLGCITADKEYDHKEDARIHKVSSSQAFEDRDQFKQSSNRIWILLGGQSACFGESGEYIAQLPGGTQKQVEFNAAHITNYGTSLVAVPTDEDVRLLQMKGDAKILSSDIQKLLAAASELAAESIRQDDAQTLQAKQKEVKELTGKIQQLLKSVGMLANQSLKEKIDSTPELKDALDYAEVQAKSLVTSAKGMAVAALTKAAQWLHDQQKASKK